MHKDLFCNGEVKIFFHRKTYCIFLKMSTNLKTAISSKIDRFHPFLPIATEKKA